MSDQTQSEADEQKRMSLLLDTVQTRLKADLPKEYASLPSGDHSSMLKTGALQVGALPANVAKNRYYNICPFDQFRVGLGAKNAYLNASFATINQQTYIISQAPLHPDYHGPDTCGDFWEAVWERDVRTIVCLAKVQPGFSGSSCYFPVSAESPRTFSPSENSSLSYRIALVSQHSLTCDVTKRVFEFNQLASSTAAATQEEHKKGGRQIVQYHFEGWPNYGVPDSTTSVRTIIQDLEATGPRVSPLPKDIPVPGGWSDTNRWTHTWVHCSGGVGRSGVFLGALATLRALAENPPRKAVDVSPVKAIVALREQRHPWCVEGPAQFVFCYRVIMDFLREGFSRK